MTKTIVILGGGHGGVHLSHYMLYLKTQFPDLKVIMVSPTEEFYVSPISVFWSTLLLFSSELTKYAVESCLNPSCPSNHPAYR